MYICNGIMKSLEMSIATKTEIAMKMVILDAIEKGHTDKNDLINYMASDTFESAAKSYISIMNECQHENTFPLDRLGNSQCFDCGEYISHLDI